MRLSLVLLGRTVVHRFLSNPSIPFPQPRQICAIGVLETGGLNSLEPLLAGILTGLPVVDADGMGRAFPELQMYVPFIRGVEAKLASIADCAGRSVVKADASSAKELEDLFREQVVAMGCVAGVSIQPMSGAEAQKHSVLGTLSLARALGDAVLKARKAKTSPLEAAVGVTGGKVLFVGSIIDITRTNEGGFSRGVITVEGKAGTPFAEGQPATVDFQNENLVSEGGYGSGARGAARLALLTLFFSPTRRVSLCSLLFIILSQIVRRKDDVLATVPDIITFVNEDTCRPFQTEELKVRRTGRVRGVGCGCLAVSPPIKKVTSAIVLRSLACAWPSSAFPVRLCCARPRP